MTKKEYKKKWLSVSEQIAQLRTRGMVIDDEESASRHLHNISYYRLSGYWYPYRMRESHETQKEVKSLTGPRTDRFWKGTTFEEVRQLYVFDQKLRSLVLEAMDRLEVALRCTLTHTVGKYGPTAYYEDETLFRRNFTKFRSIQTQKGIRTKEPEWAQWKTQGFVLFNRSKEDYAKFARKTYHPPHPIWVVSETWDLGHLTRLLEGVNYEISDQVARYFGLTSGEGLKSIWRTLRPLRNAAAHQCRLWNNSYNKMKVGKTELLESESWFIEYKRYERKDTPHTRFQLSRIGLSLSILSYMLRHTTLATTWPARLVEHLETFPKSQCEHVQFSAMALPSEWKSALVGEQK